NCRDLGEVDDVAAVNPREAAGRELLLELTKGRGREVRAVEGVDTAVVAVCLDPMDGVVVEQRLRAARADDRDLLDGRGCAPARLRAPCHHAREARRIDGPDEVVKGLDGEGGDRVALVRGYEDDR